MATLKHVLHGAVSLDATVLTVDATLNKAIDMDKSFMVFGLEQADNSPEEEWVRGQIIDPITVRFTRTAVSTDNNDIIIRYHVVEFESGVAVQRGTLTDPSSGANDISLSPSVDLSKAIALISASNTGSNLSDDEFYRAELPSTSTLRITVVDGNANDVVEWQVIEFADSAVQSGTVSFGTNDTVKTVTLPTTVDADKSWLSLSYSSDTGTGSDLGQKMVRGDLSTDGTTLTFTRENSGQALDLAYFLIEFSDETSVQRGTATLNSAELEDQVTLTTVDPEHALPILAGLYDRMGSTAFSTNDTPGISAAHLALNVAGTELTIRRGLDDADASFVWQVIEFDAQVSSGGGSGTLGALSQDWVDDNQDLRIRFTEEGQIQVGDFDAGVLSTAESLIEVHRDEPSQLPKRGIHTLGKIAGVITTAIAWMVGELELVGTAAISSIQTAVRGRLTHSSTGDSSSAELHAGDFEVINQSGTSGTPVGTAVGVQATINNQGDAYLSKASGVVAKIQNATGADIETAVALEVAPPVNDGTIDTLIGLDIPDVNQGTDNYAIRTGKGIVHLGDVIEMPTVSEPATKAGVTQLYRKSDGKLYAKDSSDNEYDLALPYPIQAIPGNPSNEGEYLGYSNAISDLTGSIQDVKGSNYSSSGTVNNIYMQVYNKTSETLRIDGISFHAFEAYDYYLEIRSSSGTLISTSNETINGTGYLAFTFPTTLVAAGDTVRVQVVGDSAWRRYYHGGNYSGTHVDLTIGNDPNGVHAPVLQVRTTQVNTDEKLIWTTPYSVGHSDNDVSNPPTKSEITSALGDATTLPNGYQGVIDDNGATTTLWLCTVSNDEWFYEEMAKAT